MGARTRGDEVVKPPKGFSNHLWPLKRVNLLIFRIFHIFFFKNLQNFSTYFFFNFFENINILAIFRLTTSSSKIPPRGPPLKKKKKVFNFTKNVEAWKFLLWHLTPRELKGFRPLCYHRLEYHYYYVNWLTNCNQKWTQQNDIIISYYLYHRMTIIRQFSLIYL